MSCRVMLVTYLRGVAIRTDLALHAALEAVWSH